MSDWARPADPTNLLLYEAIGGNGKSMLTWEWTTNHAALVRPDWAGRFWYSFYEKGAIMADFCRRALAYMTGRPLEEFAKKKTAELADELLAQCHSRPWLLILDGLERVLVAYHRIDAAELPDEEANSPTDKIADRNPRDAIREEDNDLLRALAAASPSKILVSSRLTPRVLLNPSEQPINGAKRIALPGLRPPDAEKLLRSCGIQGDSTNIQKYLSANCDNHPLVIGVLGGLINNHLSNRGNFDAWEKDPEGGARLDFASLDLVQRRNHILNASLDALSPPSRQLLSTLALVPESVDYETLKAFNPHLPPEPDEVEKAEPPENHWRWGRLSDDEKAERQERFREELGRWQVYERTSATVVHGVSRGAEKLAATVRDLEQRGLLQYDGRSRRYDLHPVVRGVAAGGRQGRDREHFGQRVIDYFSSLPHSPYEQAETLEDLRPGLNVVRTLLRLGHFQQAEDAYRGDLSDALLFNLEAYAEILSLLRPFFPDGWTELPDTDVSDFIYLANNAAIALDKSDEAKEAISAHAAAVHVSLERGDWLRLGASLGNVAASLARQNRVVEALGLDELSLDLAAVTDDQQGVFIGQLFYFCRRVHHRKMAGSRIALAELREHGPRLVARGVPLWRRGMLLCAFSVLQGYFGG